MSLAAASFFALAVLAGGCATVSTAAGSAEDYRREAAKIQAAYAQAIQDFATSIAQVKPGPEGDALKKEALTALEADLAEAKAGLQQLKPAADTLIEHAKMLGLVEGAERLTREAAQAATRLSADGLKKTAETLEAMAKQASDLSRTASEAGQR
ncbi:MAG: hypothetical protein MH204_03750 [Fimbriimonadaceae bacterium]|nr:hypothetical protein [Fimbriimonadaceae bacterium]